MSVSHTQITMCYANLAASRSGQDEAAEEPASDHSDGVVYRASALDFQNVTGRLPQPDPVELAVPVFALGRSASANRRSFQLSAQACCSNHVFSA